MKLKAIFTTLALFVAVGLFAAPLSAQNNVSLSLNLAPAGTLSITGSAITFNTAGDLFGPWTVANGTTVNFSYRSSGNGGASISVTSTGSGGAANVLVGSTSTSDVIPASDLTLQAAGSTTGLNTTATAMGATGVTLFTGAKGTHALNQSFTVTYTLGAGDFTADTYTGQLTYTLAVS